MSSSHMQNTMQVPDELLTLFSRNLTFNPEHQDAITTENTQQQPFSSRPQHLYSASQHYTHSHHLARPRTQDPETDEARQTFRPSSVPIEDETSRSEAILRSHGIESQLLTPSQLQLFKTGDYYQKLRLLQLWSICPPNGAQNIPALAWSSTSLEQEEHLARVRHERQLHIHGQAATQSMDSEPYMTAGYEEMRTQERANAHCHLDTTYNKAMDPIFLGPDFVREQQLEMASQYGAFEQMRADAMDVM